MRREFPKAVKLAAWKRSNGNCESCTAKLYPGKFDYHHDMDDTFGGQPTLDNCVVLCEACHTKVTSDRAPIIAKSNRVRAKHLGIRKPSTFPCGRNSKWKRKVSGEVVPR